jgi:hypothetical protein
MKCGSYRHYSISFACIDNLLAEARTALEQQNDSLAWPPFLFTSCQTLSSQWHSPVNGSKKEGSIFVPIRLLPGKLGKLPGIGSMAVSAYRQESGFAVEISCKEAGEFF